MAVAEVTTYYRAMKHTLRMLCLGSLLVGASTANAGGRYTDEYGNTTPDWAPAWCGNYRGATGTGYGGIADDLAKEGYFAERPMRELAQAHCEFRKSAADTAKIRGIAAKYAAEFKAALGLNDSEFDTLLSFHLNQQENGKTEKAACSRFDKIDDDLEAKDFAKEQALGRVACGASRNGEYDWFDTTAVSDVAYVVQCADFLVDDLATKSLARRPWKLVSYAQCATTAARLDRTKYVAELDAAKLAPFAYLWAKAQYQRAVDSFAKVQTYYADVAKKDPAMEDVLVKAPKAAVETFTAMRSEEQTLVDQTALMLSNLKKKPVMNRFKDCADAYWTALNARIVKAAPETLDAAQAAFDVPLVGYLTAGFVICQNNAKRGDIASTFGSKIGAIPLGPRDAALWGALQSVAAHREDIEGGSDFHGASFSSRPRFEFDGSFGGSDSGVIAAVSAPDAGVVTVKFKKESWMEPVWKCVETNRIDRVEFSSSGDAKLVYRQNCVKAGERKVEKQLPPTKVEVRFAAALKAGRFAMMRMPSSRSGSSGNGFPEQVWDTKARKKLVGYFGFGW